MPELQGAFSTVAKGGILASPIFLNLYDSGVANFPNTSSYSSGATNILKLPVAPTLSKPWTITGWSVRLNTFMMAANFPPFGRLGKIFASLILGAGGVTPTLSFVFSSPPTAALANLQTLYDGGTDPPFPFFDSVNQTSLPAGEGLLQATFQLPQPQVLDAGANLAIGLWLTPSLVASVLNISAWNAQYSVTYSS